MMTIVIPINNKNGGSRNEEGRIQVSAPSRESVPAYCSRLALPIRGKHSMLWIRLFPGTQEQILLVITFSCIHARSLADKILFPRTLADVLSDPCSLKMFHVRHPSCTRRILLDPLTSSIRCDRAELDLTINKENIYLNINALRRLVAIATEN